MPYTTYLD